MTVSEIILSIILFAVTFILGTIAGTYKIVSEEAGSLVFDRSIPGEINPVAEFRTGLDELSKKKYILLKVENRNYVKNKE